MTWQLQGDTRAKGQMKTALAIDFVHGAIGTAKDYH